MKITTKDIQLEFDDESIVSFQLKNNKTSGLELTIDTQSQDAKIQFDNNTTHSPISGLVNLLKIILKFILIPILCSIVVAYIIYKLGWSK